MNRFAHRIAALLCTAVLLTSLPACADPRKNLPPADSTDTNPEVSLADLRAHYDALVITLQGELTTLRNDATMTRETLLARIEALESALAGLGIELPNETSPADPPSPTDTLSPPIDSAPPDTETAPAPSETAESAPPTEPRPLPETTDAPTGLAYIVEHDGAVITGLHGTVPAHLIIPTVLDGHPVTAISDNAFAGLPLESVTLPATLSHIGWFAFAGCADLRTVTVPASVARIDYGAFDACPRLTVYCPADSYAARFAAASAIPYVEV